MAKVTILEFRVTDRVLTESDPDAGDVVFLGPTGDVASPFVVVRRLTGPGGTYIDAMEVLDANGTPVARKEHKFELEGHSLPKTITTEFRATNLPGPGSYVLRYSVYDEVVASYPFTATREEIPATRTVPGALDAALARGTIAWLSFDERPDAYLPPVTGSPVKDARYLARHQYPVWYGYQEGRIYVLVGPGEQEVPGLTDASLVRVIARSKDKQTKVAEIECSVARLAKDETWEAIARDLLVGRRLNLRDGDAAVGRWNQTCEVFALTPLQSRSALAIA